MLRDNLDLSRLFLVLRRRLHFSDCCCCYRCGFLPLSVLSAGNCFIFNFLTTFSLHFSSYIYLLLYCYLPPLQLSSRYCFGVTNVGLSVCGLNVCRSIRPPKSFLAIIPPQIVRFTASTDHNIFQFWRRVCLLCLALQIFLYA